MAAKVYKIIIQVPVKENKFNVMIHFGMQQMILSVRSCGSSMYNRAQNLLHTHD
jgi:hypothetical protein